MTNIAIITPFRAHTFASADTIDAVLFDLSGTLLDEGFARHAFAAVATAMSERWGIDPGTAVSDVRKAFAAVSAEVADQRFYLMRDVMCAAFARVISAHGRCATACELVALDHLMWSVAIPAAVAADGAIETILALRSAGIRTGIVSYADVRVFAGLLEQTGLAGLTDIEICSEMARSCKPHSAIFRMALEGVGVAPERAMFVGDSVESDVVGGNRLGMQTVLLAAREFAIGSGSSDDRSTHPDHHAAHLVDVLDLLDVRRTTSGEGAEACLSGTRDKTVTTLAHYQLVITQLQDRDQGTPMSERTLSELRPDHVKASDLRPHVAVVLMYTLLLGDVTCSGSVRSPSS